MKNREGSKLIKIGKIVLTIAIALVVIYMATPVIEAIYHIGIEFGEAVAKWF